MLQRLRKLFVPQQTVLKAAYGIKAPDHGLSFYPRLETRLLRRENVVRFKVKQAHVACCTASGPAICSSIPHVEYRKLCTRLFMFVFLPRQPDISGSPLQQGVFMRNCRLRQEMLRRIPDPPSGKMLHSGACVYGISSRDQARSRSSFRDNAAPAQKKASAEEQGRP